MVETVKKRRTAVYVIWYLAAIILANLAVTLFGPRIAVVTAFLFIGLDLTARDHLHDRWHRSGLLWRMAILIGTGSAVSFLLNQDSRDIAAASFIAFAAAATVDSFVYHALGKYPRWLRINGSNVPSALVDSLVFPALAFGFPLLWDIMLGQFAAKVLGGFCWSFMLAEGEEQ